MKRTDLIPVEQLVSIDRLFHERARRSPDGVAYRYFDEQTRGWRDLNWTHMTAEIARWQAALLREDLQPGDRVAIMIKNSPQWAAFDQAALGLGLVTVPLYMQDRAENVSYALEDSGAKLLLIDTAEHWRQLFGACAQHPSLVRVVALKTLPDDIDDPCLRSLQTWLPPTGGEFTHCVSDGNALATIVYTSGTTGKPKGVMLSHRNLLSNAWAGLQTFEVYPDDIMLSFLPLSHALERMAGYILPVMAGATVGFARSVQQLQDDLQQVRPTLIIAVPRIFERIHAAMRSKMEKGPVYARWLFELAVDVGYSRFEHAQGRAAWQLKHLLWPLLRQLVANKLASRMGGRLRLAVSGGAALAIDDARIFIALGLPIIQGYGLSETSPVISVNRTHSNLPTSVGAPLPGVEVRLNGQGVLEAHGPCVMLGYWNNDAATRAIMTPDGWLNTGDVANIDDQGRITITGRIKDIIVLNNGEKISPTDIETAILRDPLFEQVMVVGEGKPYLSLLAVVNRERWLEAADEHHLSGDWPTGLQQPQARAYALTRITQQIRAFPGYARIRRAALLDESWSLENDLCTPTLKLKRNKVLERYRTDYEKLYEGY